MSEHIGDEIVAQTPFRQSEDYRAGFACLVGRPNAGKSTLTNALVGEKIAITSSKPQTTRHTIRGILTTDDAQLVLVDTPGLHKPRTLLGERLNDLVRETLLEVDVIGFCLPADQKIGPGDQFIARELEELRRARRRPVVAIATKSDLVDRTRLAEHLIAIDQLGEWADIVLPHSIAVVVEEMVPREGRPEDKPLLDLRVNIFVERDSQKAIVIGRGGSRLREVGTKARTDIEKLLGQRVYLDLHVKVAKDWQRDPRQLRRLGF